MTVTTLLLLSTLLRLSYSLPTGAPREACITLAPDPPVHYIPQGSPIPYNLTVEGLAEGNYYTPGQTYTGDELSS